MRLSLIQSSIFDTEAYLKRVGAHLPKSFVARSEFSVLEDLDEAELPLVIASMPDATEAEAESIRAAVKKVSRKGVELLLGDPVVSLPAPKAPARVAGTDEADMAALLGEDPARYRARTLMIEDLAAEIRRILESKGSGEPFPELGYTTRMKKAYDAVVKLLGRVPMEDQGTVIQPGDIRALKKPFRVRKAEWDRVVEHLEAEVRFFHFIRDWFGDAGHLRVMFRDQVVLDYDFVAKINKRYKLLSDRTVVELILGKAMGMVAGKVGAIPPYGPGLSAIVNVMWAAANHQAKESDIKVKAKIDEIRDKVAEKFLASIKEAEKADLKLCGDWGLLRDFGQLIVDGKLKWPKDASKLRNAHAYGFHYECLRVLLGIKSGSQPEYHHWGMARKSRHSKKARKAKWDPKSGDYHRYSASKKESDGHYYLDYFLGGVSCSMVPMAGLVCDSAKQASKALQKKLFGVNTGDEADPDLGLPAAFLDDPKSKARKRWKLDDFRVLT